MRRTPWASISSCHQRRDLAARLLGEEHAAPGPLEQGLQRLRVQAAPSCSGDEAFAELDDPAAQRNDRVLRNIADPVVREVRAGQDQIAWLKLADEVANEIAAAWWQRRDEARIPDESASAPCGTDSRATRPRKTRRVLSGRLPDPVPCPFPPGRYGYPQRPSLPAGQLMSALAETDGNLRHRHVPARF